MPERTLAILVTARDLATKTLRGVNKELGGINGTARRLGRGIGTAAGNIARLGAVAAGEEDEVLVELEPDAVVAVDPG